MRFYDRYSQLVLNKELPMYLDVKHIHSNKSLDLTGNVRLPRSKYNTKVVLPKGSSVWMVQDLNESRV